MVFCYSFKLVIFKTYAFVYLIEAQSTKIAMFRILRQAYIGYWLCVVANDL